MINILDIAKPLPYQSFNNVINSESDFWHLLEKIEPVCKCGCIKTITINDFADVLHLKDTKEYNHKGMHGTIVKGYGYTITTEQKIKISVNKTHKPKVLAHMGTHVIIECSNCKANYTKEFYDDAKII